MQMHTITTYKEINEGYRTELDEKQSDYFVASFVFVIIMAGVVSLFIIIRFRLRRNIHNLSVLKESNNKLDNLIWYLNVVNKDRRMSQLENVN